MSDNGRFTVVVAVQDESAIWVGMPSGAAGPPGPAGPAGPQGIPGPPGPPGTGEYVQVRQAGPSQPLPNGVFTAVAFDTEDFNPNGMHDVAFPSRLTAPVAGTYRLGGAIAVSFNGAGYRAAHWSVNGVIVPQSPAVFAGSDVTGAHVMCVSLLVGLNPGDYVEIVLFQNSGVDLSTVTANEFQSFINMMRVA